jgi:hypothetical protein
MFRPSIERAAVASSRQEHGTHTSHAGRRARKSRVPRGTDAPQPPVPPTTSADMTVYPSRTHYQNRRNPAATTVQAKPTQNVRQRGSRPNWGIDIQVLMFYTTPQADPSGRCGPGQVKNRPRQDRSVTPVPAPSFGWMAPASRTRCPRDNGLAQETAVSAVPPPPEATRCPRHTAAHPRRRPGPPLVPLTPNA